MIDGHVTSESASQLAQDGVIPSGDSILGEIIVVQFTIWSLRSYYVCQLPLPFFFQKLILFDQIPNCPDPVLSNLIAFVVFQFPSLK